MSQREIMTNVELLAFGGFGLIIIIILIILSIWSSVDDKPKSPEYPPSDADEIRKYLSGKIKRGGENGKKEEKEDS